MFVRLNGKKIDLRTVRKVTRVNDKNFKIEYNDNTSENISTDNKEPTDTLDLMNAMLILFKDIEINEQ